MKKIIVFLIIGILILSISVAFINPKEKECKVNLDCGEDGYIEDKYCLDKNVTQKYRTYSCLNYQCSSLDSEINLEGCSFGCLNGICQIQVFECSSGQEKCLNKNHYLCQDNRWVDKGLVDSKCGYINPLPSECSQNSDCVLQNTGCCPCSSGGSHESMTLAEAEIKKLELLNCPSGLFCMAMYNCKYSEAICINGQCRGK